MKLKHYASDFLTVTQAAALAAAKFVGKGDKIGADYAATVAMRNKLNEIEFCGRVAISEGVKDNAPSLLFNEKLGSLESESACFSIGCDSIDGTTPTSKGGNEAMSILAVSDKRLFASNSFYMKKLAYGPQIASKKEIKITDPLDKIIDSISQATGKDKTRITFCVLDRPRHDRLITDIRKFGCRIKLIQDCDVSATLATIIPDSGIDLYIGIGGAPEGVLSAAALKCAGGKFQGILCDKDGNDTEGSIVHNIPDLVSGAVVFCATGITDGSILKGVNYTSWASFTHSIFMYADAKGSTWWYTKGVHKNEFC